MSPRRGMTLVEMLVATTLTLIIMGVIAQLFGILGNSISRSRAALITSAQLRAVSHALRIDLAGATAPTVPPVAADADAGYLEIIEGPTSDIPSPTTPPLIGDCDDALLFTTSTLDRPYVGLFAGNSSIESRTAEVAWFCRPSAVTTAGMTLYDLYRRQLLVLDYVGAGAFATGSNRLSVTNFGVLPAATFSVLQQYDLSLRAEGTEFLPNTLGDLTKRENRFAHNPGGPVSISAFPYAGTAANLSSGAAVLSGSRQGEEIVLRNVLAFDVRAFDPEAAIRAVSGSTVGLVPGDPGYGAPGSNPVALGCYVDLGSLATSTGSTTLTGSAAALSKLTRIYDTWSTHYECNGIDENSDTVVDGGTDGLDNNVVNGVLTPNGVVDDDAERDTQPPYPVPLRGIEIRIRCYEPSSREVRQVTVRHTFVPH